MDDGTGVTLISIDIMSLTTEGEMTLNALALDQPGAIGASRFTATPEFAATLVHVNPTALLGGGISIATARLGVGPSAGVAADADGVSPVVGPRVRAMGEMTIALAPSHHIVLGAGAAITPSLLSTLAPAYGVHGSVAYHTQSDTGQRYFVGLEARTDRFDVVRGDNNDSGITAYGGLNAGMAF